MFSDKWITALQPGRARVRGLELGWAPPSAIRAAVLAHERDEQRNLNWKDMRTLEEIDAYLDTHVSMDQLSKLESAHLLYVHLCGIAGRSITKVDRLDAQARTCTQLIKHTPEGRPIFTSDDCIAFMACVSGAPAECCRAWLKRSCLTAMLDEHAGSPVLH